MGDIINLDEERAALISVVSPMYNEGEKIRAGLEKLFTALDGLGRPYEVILVNDGSLDNSLEEASHHLEREELTIVSYSKNRGRGYATLASGSAPSSR